MNRTKLRLSRSRVFLCLLCATLIALVARQIYQGTALTLGSSTNRTQERRSLHGVEIPPAGSIEAYEEIISRTLFDPHRRPPPEPANSPMSSPQAAQLATRWKLTGIVVADHDRYAILTDKKRKESKSLGTGAKLDGWVLASIDLDGVKFALGARSVRLPLIEKREGRH